jgi:hypothetical protein
MRHIPSKERLYKVFPHLQEHNNQLRYLLNDWKQESISSRDMMTEANGLLEGHGVEHIRSRNGKAEAYYVNMGDTYTATILLDIGKDRVWATSWGDWLETEERQGNKFD